jgi:hypothetical protein
MLRDLFTQACEAMLYNRRRTLITMIGMAWGIATVVLLMAYGAGFGRAIEAIFSQFGTNLMGVFPGTTSEQAGGKKAGVQVKFQLADVDLLQNTVPGILHIVPEVSKDVTVQNDAHSYTWTVAGSYPADADVQKLDLDYGRFYTDKDLEERNHVAVIGSEAKTKLYSGLYPLGQRIRIKGVSFTVIGVLRAKMQEGDDNINRVIYIPFTTMSDVKDTKYLDAIWFNYRGNYLTTESALRGALGSAHGFPASDHNAIYVANLLEQLSQFRIIADAGNCGHRLDEHHAGSGTAAHPRDWDREGAGCISQAHPDPVSERGAGDNRRRRNLRNCAGLPGLGSSGTNHFVQCHCGKWRSRRHSTIDFAQHSHSRDGNSSCGRPGQRHVARVAGRQPRSSRSSSLRITNRRSLHCASLRSA